MPRKSVEKLTRTRGTVPFLSPVQPPQADRICPSLDILRHIPRIALVLALLAAWICLFGGPSPASAGTALPPWRPHRVDPAAEVEPTCRRISGKLASIGLEDCMASGLRNSGARSVEGTPILLRELFPSTGRQPRGRVLLFGGIHGDEYSSVSVVFKWLQMLDRLDSGRFHWRVIPLLNPDGLLRSRSQRMNARGVDLNRNFPCADWLAATREYWVRRTARNPRRYPGSGPLSEPESRYLATEIRRFRPDAIVAVHAPFSVLDFDGPPDPPRRLGSLRLDPLGTYPGSLGRYAGIQMNLPIVTIELPSAGIMPPVVEQRRMWTDLVGWLSDRLPPVDRRLP